MINNYKNMVTILQRMLPSTLQLTSCWSPPRPLRFKLSRRLWKNKPRSSLGALPRHHTEPNYFLTFQVSYKSVILKQVKVSNALTFLNVLRWHRWIVPMPACGVAWSFREHEKARISDRHSEMGTVYCTDIFRNQHVEYLLKQWK